MNDANESKERSGFFSRLKDGLTGAGEDLAAAEGYIEDAELAPWQHVELTDEQKMRLFERLTRGLQQTGSNIGQGLGNLILGQKTIDDDLLEEIETQLLMADIGIEATQTIIDNITDKVNRKQLADSEALYQALQSELTNLLVPAQEELVIDGSHKPYVILIVGVNGVGKTTTIGKLAKQLQVLGKSVMLAAGDTFRAAAVEQLQVWGERNNVPVVAQHTGADSASVIFDALQAAKSREVDVLIADTAGRLHTQNDLMTELQKVKRVMQKVDPAAPHETLLVIDASMGQNALRQAQEFHRSMQLTGLCITKLDGTAKGGVVLSIADQLGLPIRYIGVGEAIEDLQVFDAVQFADALLGLEPDT